MKNICKCYLTNLKPNLKDPTIIFAIFKPQMKQTTNVCSMQSLNLQLIIKSVLFSLC